MTIKKSERRNVKLPTTFEPLFWASCDRRITAVREIQKRYEQLKEDTGVDNTQRELLCQRAAFIAIRLETMEVEAVQEGRFDPGVYSNLNNTLLGLLKALGLEKKSQARTVDLKAYVKERSS